MKTDLRALILLADGTEEMEAVITCDILVRAGINLTRASVGLSSGCSFVTCANGMKLLADTTLEEIMSSLSDFAIIILPGGSKGAKTFTLDDNVQKALKLFAQHKYVAAICAAPLALRHAEIFKGANVTCYPSLENQLTRGNFYQHDETSNTVIDGRLITSRGPGTAFDFALQIVKVLTGEIVRNQVASDLLFDDKMLK